MRMRSATDMPERASLRDRSASSHHSRRRRARVRPPGRWRPIRVVLAESDPDVRRHMRALLDGAGRGDFEVVAETASTESARRFAHAHRPCVLVLDLGLPGGSSLDAIPVIRGESPQTHIVALVTPRQGASVCDALRAGATGYVLEECAHEALADAVRCAAAGHGYLTPFSGAHA